MTAQPDQIEKSNQAYEGFLYAAHKDILAVEALSAADAAVHCEAITFHCQQAAEKMLKNVFVQNDMVPQKTHDIGNMLSKAIACEWVDASDAEVKAAVDLTFFAVVARYETSPDISRGEAVKAIDDCNVIAEMLARNGYESVFIEK